MRRFFSSLFFMSELKFILNDELPECVKMEEVNDGLVKCKTISISDFVKALTSSSTGVVSIDYFLPENCIKFFCAGDTIGIAFTVDKRVAPVMYIGCGNDEPYILPYPKLLFVTYYTNEKLISAKVFAIKEGSGSNPELFYFPYGNVYDDGKICYGDNPIALNGERLDLATKEFIDVFYSSPYNGDLYKIDNTAYFCSLSEVFKKLNNKEEFPENMLISTKKNFKEVVLCSY